MHRGNAAARAAPTLALSSLLRHRPPSRLPVVLVVALAIAGVGACSSAAPSIDPGRTTVEAVSRPSASCDLGRPYFEFQVEVPARWIADSASQVAGAIRPGPATRGDTLTVQFIVDTLGRAEPGTFKVLVARRPEFADSARQLVPSWRWMPARLGSCRVRQLVQTGITHR